VNYAISFIGNLLCGIAILRILKLNFNSVDRSAVVAFWAGLACRVCVALILHFGLAELNYQGKGGLYYSDESTYLQMGLISKEVLGSNGDLFQTPVGNQAYVNLLGILFFVWGPDILLIRFWMALIGASAVPVTYSLAKSIYGNSQIARNSAWAVAFFPPLVIHSIVLIREIVITLFLTASAYFVGICQRSRVAKCGLVMSILVLFYFRTSLGLISIVLLVGVGLMGKMEHRMQYFGLVGIVILIFCFFR